MNLQTEQLVVNLVGDILTGINSLVTTLGEMRDIHNKLINPPQPVDFNTLPEEVKAHAIAQSQAWAATQQKVQEVNQAFGEVAQTAQQAQQAQQGQQAEVPPPQEPKQEETEAPKETESQETHE